MRFYDPATDPPDQLESSELFPNLDANAAAAKCLRFGLLPSVTNILGTIRQEYLERWKMSEAIKNYQRHGNAWLAVDEHFNMDSQESKFGTRVHDCIHKYVTGQPLEESKELTYALPAIEWLKKNTKELLESETTIACTKTGVAGTIDLAIVDKNGQATVADLKVVKIRTKFPPLPPLAYRCQLSAYAEILRVKTGRTYKRISLYLASPFGDATQPKLMAFPYEKDYLPEFQACLTIWHAQYGNSFEKVQDILHAEKEEFDIKNYKK